ncbi:MAG: hypothetical protein HYW89_00480 [Candidatus Sungiibacteriota bacterium]|uniref:Uncharacterized protein n=1 Tax=Candidatus Sungiibacteriota bacterium TaxID=2750080 RepID=A0A7T5UQS0_9BACT|nr:MAG: hypothetical protein HYW89_00480 [Candidatus Sungbacteria bacterium]
MPDHELRQRRDNTVLVSFLRTKLLPDHQQGACPHTNSTTEFVLKNGHLVRKVLELITKDSAVELVSETTQG